MASELMLPDAVNFLDSMLRDNSALRVDEVKLGQHSKFSGKKLEQCDVFSSTGVVLLSLKRHDGFEFNPPPHTVLSPGDTMIVIGNPDQIFAVRSKLSSS